MSIYLLIDGQQQGPYTEEKVRQSLAEELISPDLPAWKEGLTNWVPLRHIVQLAALPITAPSVRTPLPQTVPEPAPRQTGANAEGQPRVDAGNSSKTGRAAPKHDWIGLDNLSSDKAPPWAQKAFFIIWVVPAALIGLASVGRFFTHPERPAPVAQQPDQTVQTDTANQPTPTVKASEDWTPEAMLQRAADSVKQDGVGVGTVSSDSVSSSVVDQANESGLFVGRIDFTLQLDAGNLGSTQANFHAFFSYDPKRQEWSALKLTDSNGQESDDSDSQNMLSTIKHYLPEPYLIFLHSK